MNSKLRVSQWIGHSVVALSAGLLVAGCGHKDGQAAAPAGRPPANVTTVAASTQDVPIYIDQIGRTVSVEVVSIIPQVGGKVISAHVNDGTYVKKGDLLFEIDPRPFKASLASVQASLAQSKADLTLARTEYNRAEDLVKTSAVSQLEYEQKKSAFEVAEAKVLGAESAIETAKLNLEYATIRSPIEGRAGARLVDAGNIVKENEGSMLVLQRLDPIYVEFTVTENELSTVRRFAAEIGRRWDDDANRGLKVLVDIPAAERNLMNALTSFKPTTAPSATQPSATQPSANPSVVSNDSNAPATAPTATASSTTVPSQRAGAREGELTFLDNTVQGASGTVKLRATVPNADRYFWPGQFVTVRLVLTTRKDATVVPVQAQQIGQQGPFVYVVKADGTAEARPIVPGQRQGDMVVVEKGIEPGEQVIVVGQMMVMPGAKVNVANNPPAAPGPQANAAAAH